MKKFIMLAIALLMVLTVVADGYCAIRYINPYFRGDGTYVSGHYRDTSGDGNPYNNANYLGLNGR